MKSVSGSRLGAGACGLVLACAVAQAFAQSRGFEAAPAIPAAQLAPPALLRGAGFEVGTPVLVDRFLGSFELSTKSGRFRVVGVDMLAIRERELHAIDELRKVESSSAFGDAVAKSAAAPVKLAGSLVTDPGATVENIASGAGTVLGRIGYSVKSGLQNAGDTLAGSSPDQNTQKPSGDADEPPSFIGDPLGYNRARREWAKQLGVDPYTSNPVLRPLLDRAASATFAGNFTVGLAVGAVAAPLNYATSFEGTVKDSVWNHPPGDLAKSNDEALTRMGVPAAVVRAFLRNRWFTPTLQTALVSTLGELNAASGRDSVVRAASTISGEVPARFLVRAVALLDQFNRATPVTQVRVRGIVPIGQSKSGEVVAAAAVDYLYWNEEAAAFANAPELAAAKRTLLVQGQVSPLAAMEFARAGWRIRNVK